MSDIIIDSNPDKADLDARGVFDWSIWTCEPSDFPWTYDATEQCYLLEGLVEVTPDGGETVTIKAGDFVTFPKDMSCRWVVREPVRKHYTFI